MSFPSDVSGEDLQKALAALRLSRPKRKLRFPKPVVVEWLTERMPSGCPAEVQAFAYIGEFRLFVVEMRYYFMLQQPKDVPRISWSFGENDDDTDPLAGGAAPSLAVAMLRAEQALRVYLEVDD